MAVPYSEENDDFLNFRWLLLDDLEFQALKKIALVVSAIDNENEWPEQPTPAEQAALMNLIKRIREMP